MANELTGDFDVVVEVGVPALNRILGTQHQSGSLLHSFATRIEDAIPVFQHIGRFLVQRQHLGIREFVATGASAATTPEVSIEGSLACRFEKEILSPVEYTGISGFVEVQVSTPTITLEPNLRVSRVTIHYQIMAHFIADQGTPAMPEFIHGELQATVDVNQVATQIGNVIEIDFAADDVAVVFNTIWSSPPLSSAQSRQLNQLVRNLLRTRFQPVNATLPQGIQQIFFKTMPYGTQPATALLLDLRDDAPQNPDPGAVYQVFLSATDDFAVAIGRDYVIAILQDQIAQALSTANLSVQFNVLFWTIYYQIQINNFTVDLQAGQIVLTLNGHAHTGSIFPDFDFTLTQAVTLNLVGGVVVLDYLGDPNFTVNNTIAGWIIGIFSGNLTSRLIEQRDQILGPAQASIRDALDSRRNLGAFLEALNISANLSYTSLELLADGLILHGALSVDAWREPHVEFTLNTTANQDGSVDVELNALNSWVPGGTVRAYWWWTGNSWFPFAIDEHSFVTRHTVNQNEVSAEWCLLMLGTRTSPSGPPAEESVSGLHCTINRLVVGAVFSYPSAIARLPVVVTADTGRGLKVVAHIDVLTGNTQLAENTANMVVHFADRESEPNLAILRDAILASDSRDSAIVIVVVLPPGNPEWAQPISFATNQILYFAEDCEDSWRRVFGAKEVPATYLVNRQGQIVWRNTGRLEATTLTVALSQFLSPGGSLLWQEPALAVQKGARAPDFLFPYGQDRCMALRKLQGRPVLLNFWTSWSKPSLGELRSLQNLQDQLVRDGVVLLAINDGENPQRAKEVFEEHGFTFTLIADVSRQIARLYGINCWPTTISINKQGFVENIRWGATCGRDLFTRQGQAMRAAAASVAFDEKGLSPLEKIIHSQS